MNPVTDNSTAQAATAQTDVNDDLAKALASIQAGPQENMAFETVGEPALSSVPAAPALENEPIETPIPAAPVMAAPAAPVTPMPTSTPMTDDVAGAVEYSTPPATIDHTVVDVVQDPAPSPAPAPASNLADSIEQIKISALSQLRPLMQHIELSPEEKFEKYLMMLRASDDQNLIQPTYEAAQQISSEKLKAQALLDVINEINYLTSQQLVA